MDTVTRPRSWLNPPAFPADQEKTRVAGVLHTVLLTVLAGLGVYIVFIWTLNLSALRLILIAPLSLIVLALLFVMRRGHVYLASIALCSCLWAAATAGCLIAGGVRAPVFSGYVIVVLVAGMLLGWRSAVGFAGLSLVTSLALLYASNTDLVPTTLYVTTNTTIWITQIVFLLWGTMLLCLARRSEDDALQRVRSELAERKRAEAALRESEARYERLAEAAFEGIGFCDNHIIFDTNARLATMLGYTPDELIGIPTEQLVAPESRDLVRRRVQTGYQGMYEHLAQRKDGSVFPVEVRSRYAQHQGRRIRITVVRDNSERIATQHALSQSELRFRVAFHANPTPQLLTRAADGLIIDANAAYERLVGYTRDDLLGKLTTDLTVWVEWDREHLLDELRSSGRIADRATQVRTRSGDICDIILSMEEVQIGEAACHLSVMLDITKRKQAEQEIGLLQSTALAIGEAANPQIAFGVALEKVCEATGWFFGQGWTPCTDGSQLEHSGAWYSCAPGKEAFRRHSEALVFPPGVGLPGRVWQSKHAAWVQDVTVDANFPRAEMAREVGFKAGMAFPVLAGEEVVAVMEFFVVESRAEDARLVKLVSAVAAQLGTAIQRKRAEDELQRSAKRLRSLHEIDLAILAARSPEAISEGALERMWHLVPYQWASVSLFDFADREVMTLASRGTTRIDSSVGKRVSLAAFPDNELILEELRQGQVRIVEDIGTLPPASAEAQLLHAQGVRSFTIIPLLSRGELVGALLLGMDRPGPFAPDAIDVAQEVGSQLAVAIQQARLFAQVRAGHQRLQSLSRQLIQAQEAERRRIARELHDEIGQALALIKLNIRAVQQMARTLDLAPRLEQSLGIIEATLLRVRALALDLRPAMLDDLGLVAALRWYLDQQAQASGLVAELRAETNGHRLPSEIETVCFRVVQEALTNILRHAHAHRVQIEIEQSATTIQLVIQDDGAGFDAQQKVIQGTHSRSGGLLGMHERVALAGGQLTIESAPASGTTIHVWIPLESQLSGIPPAGEEAPDVIDPRSIG
jgi:PAS domain S-box-containing protein